MQCGKRKLGAVRRHAGLLPPRVCNRPRVERVEPGIVEQLLRDRFAGQAVACYWNSDPVISTCGLATVSKCLSDYCVERFDDGPAELLLAQTLSSSPSSTSGIRVPSCG